MPDPTTRWKRLSPRSRLGIVLRLVDAVKTREASVFTYPDKAHGGQLNRTKVKTLLAQDRAVLAILRAVLEPELWEHALRVAEFDPFDPAEVDKLRGKLAAQTKAMLETARKR